MNECWLCHKMKPMNDDTPPGKMCRECASKLQGEVRLCPMEKSTPMTHEEWVERGKRIRTANVSNERRQEPPERKP
jgi:hypothetical protein